MAEKNDLAKWLDDYFRALRFDPHHHLGLGDIRLTRGQQDDLVAAAERAYQELQAENHQLREDAERWRKHGHMLIHLLEQCVHLLDSSLPLECPGLCNQVRTAIKAARES